MSVHGGATPSRITKQKPGSGDYSSSAAGGHGNGAIGGGNGSAGSGGAGGNGSLTVRKMFALRDMEPPVSSFYGAEPIPLPQRFANIKRRLVAGREADVEASWRRLLAVLRAEIAHVEGRKGDVVPTIEFDAVDDPVKAECFGQSLRRYGVGVIRGVVLARDADSYMADTLHYLDQMRELKPPPPQDPTCFDLFWTPAQIRARAHPNVLRAQKFAMSFWETGNGTGNDMGLATRFPIAYADRLRIHNYNFNNVRTGFSGGGSTQSSLSGTENNAPGPGATATGSSTGGGASASTTNLTEPSTIIFQVDNGSLERWEPDGYGRSGAYDAIFRGDWESYDPWSVAGRLGATPDLYNGAGACSIFRLFQGILALTAFEKGMIRVLPNPKLVTAYFLLRPFFSARKKSPPRGTEDDPARANEWAAFLDADNWTMDSEQSTIIHGAVPGHAQRITEMWHPHLHLRKSPVELPALRTGDYIIWHCDEPYSIVAVGPTPSSTAPTVPPSPSLLIYIPACPLTQTNALFMARQRKAMLKGDSGPDFDRIGLGFGNEQPRTEDSVRAEIAAVGGDDGLRAIGLEPFDTRVGTSLNSEKKPASDNRMNTDGGDEAALTSWSGAEAEVVRMANIILFPDRYEFYMPPSANAAKGKAKR